MELNKYLIHVDGMTCASCVQKLENIPKYNSDVKSAHVYFGQSLLEVETHHKIDPLLLIEEVRKLGFKSELLENKAQIFEANKKANREHLGKLAVAGFCAGNIMLATIPLYTGVETEYRVLFSYLSFFLFLPVVLYSALDFYKNAWRSLKTKNLNIDLPITVALLAGFIFSTWNLLNAEFDYLYYDSTASFIFLILSARYLLSRLQQNFVATYSDSDFGLNQSYELLGGQAKKKEELVASDIILLKRNQTLPTKAKIITNHSEWSMALISGESFPKDFQSGMIIESGAVLLSEVCEVEVLESYRDSLVFRFQEKLENIKKSKSEFVSFTDRFSHYFIFTVFAVAIIFAVFYARIDAFAAFQRSLALLIVACPCALALGTPLAYLLGAFRAKQQGILIFKKDIFDRVLDVKSIFFDKTGTLTQGQISVAHVVPFDPELINIVLNLEIVSQHPIAFAIRKKYINHYYDLGIKAQEIVGVGIEGVWKNDVYRFVKNVHGADRMSSVLYKNNEPVLVFYFEDKLRADTSIEIQKLVALDKTVSLLTGDQETIADEIADSCNIAKVYANHTPEMKKDVVLKNAPALMVGDGLNDALALQSAHIGISVCGSVQMSADHSDAYLLKNGISQISTLFALSQKVRATVFTNLGISLFYNIIAGYFALTGHIDPLVAAVLMPISSFAILLNTLRGVR